MARTSRKIKAGEICKYQEKEEGSECRRALQGSTGRIQRVYALLQRPQLHLRPRLWLHHRTVRGVHEETWIQHEETRFYLVEKQTSR